MKEKVLTGKKNGLAVLIGVLFVYVAAIFGCLAGIAFLPELFVLCVIVMCIAWIPLLGLKVLGPQEALVLTLFGRYIGTLKGEGFYAVNPFCVAVNPAAATQLNQSGDVKTLPSLSASSKGTSVSLPVLSKKISLKVMTLNNNRQKINDCLGNPVEIGIAVTWRIVDTARAVFDVDNYKEFLSLQCDTALRNIVRLYPYDMAPNVDTTGDGVADDGSLRGSSEVVASRIRSEIQDRTHHLPRIRAGDRGGHAPAPAGFRHHRRAEDDRGRCGRYGGNGSGTAFRKPGRHTGRRAEGRHGFQPARSTLRQPRRPAGRQFRQPVLSYGRQAEKAGPASPLPQAVRSHRCLGRGRFPLRQRTDRVSAQRMRKAAEEERQVRRRRNRRAARTRYPLNAGLFRRVRAKETPLQADVIPVPSKAAVCAAVFSCIPQGSGFTASRSGYASMIKVFLCGGKLCYNRYGSTIVSTK